MSNAPYNYNSNTGVRRIQRGGAVLALLSPAGILSSDELDIFGEKIVAALNAYKPVTVPFADMKPSQRRDVVLPALDRALRDLLAAVGTPELVAAIAEELGLPDKADQNKLATILTHAAAAGEVPEAQRSEETFERYGTLMRRWVWSPRVDK